MDKVRQWSLLTAVGVIAVLAAGWFLLVSPEHSKAASLRAKATSVTASNSTLSNNVEMLRSEQKNLPRQQSRLAQIATKIPSNPALPSLIRSLSVAANGAGVDLVSIAPGVPALATATGGTGAVSAHAAPLAGGLAQVPVSIQVQGTYFNIEQFMSNVENMPRAMLTSGLSISPGNSSATSGAGGSSSTNKLTAQLTARVFMDAPAAAATPIKPVAPSTASK